LELLTTIFSHLPRDALQAALERSDGNVVACIDALLHTTTPQLQQHGNTSTSLASNTSMATAFLAGMIPRPAPLPIPPSTQPSIAPLPIPTFKDPNPSPYPLLTPSLLPPLGLGGSGFKSAFSPIGQPPTAHLNAVRYGNYSAAATAAANAYAQAAASAGKNVSTLLSSYPFLSALSGGYGYPAAVAAANANHKAFHYPGLCSCCPAKPLAQHSASADKTGCVSD
jgi:hypothetical protein